MIIQQGKARRGRTAATGPGLGTLGLVLLAVVGAPAVAQTGSEGPPGVIDEVRIGLLDHDIGLLGRDKESGFDLNGEVLFTPPALLAAIGAPRPHIGFSVNSDDNTHQVYGGLTWSLTVAQDLWTGADSAFVAGSLGATVHDGELENAPLDRKELGLRVLFRESIEAGYRLDRYNSLSVLLDHVSNALLAESNEGITSLGVRYGIRF